MAGGEDVQLDVRRLLVAKATTALAPGPLPTLVARANMAAAAMVNVGAARPAAVPMPRGNAPAITPMGWSAAGAAAAGAAAAVRDGLTAPAAAAASTPPTGEVLPVHTPPGLEHAEPCLQSNSMP